MELTREAYDRSLDAGAPAADLQLAYEDAQAQYEQTPGRGRRRPRRDRRRRLGGRGGVRADPGRAELDGHPRVGREFRRLAPARRRRAGQRLCAPRPLRKTGSRYSPLGLAAVGFAAVLALVMAGDYVTDYVDPLEFGPLVLAAVGVGLTLVAFVALQRYLQKRIPLRRIRKGECPLRLPGPGRVPLRGLRSRGSSRARPARSPDGSARSTAAPAGRPRGGGPPQPLPRVDEGSYS